MNLQQLLFSARGRIRRRDYWVWGIVTLIAYVFACGFGGGVLGVAGLTRAENEGVFNLMILILGIPYYWTNVCLGAKRWHDRDKSGWMYLIKFIPLIGGVWTLIECGFLDGTQGGNRYGVSPKGVDDQSSVF
ncbi:DUF805 domain-containing protein [Asticcacaulis sp. AC402]|uniref:DUF805 domain-containing protein n=1 Tax=Asticcacaulis sp. AC402 TaxID=1282361 RepID=UPI0003C3D283|nr:DUF805 domain-containing protein [Asticcacaulis sp. AC402]ESQ73700.1 hypothetical protein ABAC402_17700 [Asticcacaulis sp. AC402]